MARRLCTVKAERTLSNNFTFAFENATNVPSRNDDVKKKLKKIINVLECDRSESMFRVLVT